MITFTFDEGLADTYHVAFPLMRKYGFKGVIFIVTNTFPKRTTTSFRSVENWATMTFEQLKNMLNAGWEIGSHSITHRDMRSLSLEDAERELTESKSKLEEWGFNPISFAYPYGRGPFKQELVDSCLRHYKYVRNVTYVNVDNKPHLKGGTVQAIPVGDYGEQILPNPVDTTGWRIYLIHTVWSRFLFERWLKKLKQINAKVLTFKEACSLL